VPLIRPKNPGYRTRRASFPSTQSASAPTADRLTFGYAGIDRVAAYFHTGGTTGMPKVAQHKYSGMIYNGWLGGGCCSTKPTC
jgi:fatty-acyl-CoA synthase